MQIELTEKLTKGQIITSPSQVKGLLCTNLDGTITLVRINLKFTLSSTMAMDINAKRLYFAEIKNDIAYLHSTDYWGNNQRTAAMEDMKLMHPIQVFGRQVFAIFHNTGNNSGTPTLGMMDVVAPTHTILNSSYIYHFPILLNFKHGGIKEVKNMSARGWVACTSASFCLPLEPRASVLPDISTLMTANFVLVSTSCLLLLIIVTDTMCERRGCLYKCVVLPTSGATCICPPRHQHTNDCKFCLNKYFMPIICNRDRYYVREDGLLVQVRGSAYLWSHHTNDCKFCLSKYFMPITIDNRDRYYVREEGLLVQLRASVLPDISTLMTANFVLISTSCLLSVIVTNIRCERMGCFYKCVVLPSSGPTCVCPPGHQHTNDCKFCLSKYFMPITIDNRDRYLVREEGLLVQVRGSAYLWSHILCARGGVACTSAWFCLLLELRASVLPDISTLMTANFVLISTSCLLSVIVTNTRCERMGCFYKCVVLPSSGPTCVCPPGHQHTNDCKFCLNTMCERMGCFYKCVVLPSSGPTCVCPPGHQHTNDCKFCLSKYFMPITIDNRDRYYVREEGLLVQVRGSAYLWTHVRLSSWTSTQ
ncbi:hypothetical protein J6590_008946 [Homalodisca vitripennis]|nr:hypothetical protein J6590_008946 [Homalodisca vitripennis]